MTKGLHGSVAAGNLSAACYNIINITINHNHSVSASVDTVSNIYTLRRPKRCFVKEGFELAAKTGYHNINLLSVCSTQSKQHLIVRLCVCVCSWAELTAGDALPSSTGVQCPQAETAPRHCK